MSKKFFEYAGIAASILLIIFGAASVIAGVSGRSTVRNEISKQQIVGTPDMTPKAIAGEAKGAGLKNVSLPTCSVAGKTIKNGADARCFASYMRIHTLEATGGQLYSQMPQFIGKDGRPTEDKTAAAIDPKTKAPVQNQARNVWVTETALTTALNTSFFAENVALFSIAMGIALLLAGAGFLVVSLRWLRARPSTGTARVTGTVPATA